MISFLKRIYFNRFPLVGILGFLLVLAMTTGCESEPSPIKQTQKISQGVNPLRLESEVHNLIDESFSASIATLSDIAATNPDRRIRENCLRWKIRCLNFYLILQSIEDPRARYLLGWTAVVNLRQYWTEGLGKQSFGPAQPQIVNLVTMLEEKIITTGYHFFPTETINAAKDEIEESALEFVWDSPLVAQVTLAEAKGKNSLLKILSLPLMPITSFVKLGNTPEAINKFTNTAGAFSQVVYHLPDRMRWQLEMLLLEMESSGPTAAIIQQIQNMEQRIQELITLFKAMPADMRGEFEKSIAATEKSLPEFNATLKEARAVAEKTNAAIENANKTTLQAQETAVQFTQTAKAFEATTLEVRNLLTEYRHWQNNKEEKKGGSTAKDYEQMAESIHAAAQEVRTLVDELQQPVEEEGTLRQVAGESRKVIGTLFWYAVALAGIVFVLAITYRVTIRRLIPETTKLG